MISREPIGRPATTSTSSQRVRTGLLGQRHRQPPCTAVSTSTRAPSASAVRRPPRLRDDLAVHRHGHAGPRQAQRAERVEHARVRRRARAASPLIQTTTRYLLGAAGRRSGAGSATRTGPGTGSPRSRAGDGVRGDGREQHPVAVVAGGDEQAVRAERADQRQVVRAARPQPGRRLDQRVLGDPRKDPLGVAQQVAHPADGDRGVEADLGLGGAEHEPVGARHQVDGPAVDQRAHRPAGRREGAGPQREPQDLALHRPDQPVQRRVQPGRVRPRGDEHGVGRALGRRPAQRGRRRRARRRRARPPPRSRRTPRRPARPPCAARRAGPGCRRPGRRAPTARRGRPGRARAPAGAARGRSAARPARPSRARCAARVSSSARSPEPVAATIVPSVRSPAGRPAASASSAANAGQRRDRLDAQRQQLLLARPRLGDGGEHAAGHPGGARRGRRVENRDPPPLLRGAPGAAQPDDAGAQHQQL